MTKPTRRSRPTRRSVQSFDIEGIVEKYTFLRDLRCEVLDDLVGTGTPIEGGQATDDVSEKMLKPIDEELQHLTWALVRSSAKDPAAIKAKAQILRELLDQEANEVAVALARSVAEDVCNAF